ncbi:hypothetical protein [Nonomuraea wenchangensis]|uniref:hypothetical protein n=1 Tax=Nonomuraea wenchangensis TaxID=568860 RepID=UPI00332FD6C2
MREAYALTSVDLAERIRAESGIDVHPDHILNVELGHQEGSRRLMTAWANALRIKPIDVHRPRDLRERFVAGDEAEAGAA